MRKLLTWARSFRFRNGSAIFDYVMTIAMACLLSDLTTFPLELMTIALFALGILLHWVFRIPTRTNMYLFGIGAQNTGWARPLFFFAFINRMRPNYIMIPCMHCRIFIWFDVFDLEHLIYVNTTFFSFFFVNTMRVVTYILFFLFFYLFYLAQGYKVECVLINPF